MVARIVRLARHIELLYDTYASFKLQRLLLCNGYWRFYPTSRCGNRPSMPRYANRSTNPASLLKFNVIVYVLYNCNKKLLWFNIIACALEISLMVLFFFLDVTAYQRELPSPARVSCLYSQSLTLKLSQLHPV